MPGETTHSKYIWDYFMNVIGNEYGVAGLMGNLYAESALRPNNLQQTYETSLGFTDTSYTQAVDNGTYTKDQFVHDSAGYGLAQWTYWSRKEGLYSLWKTGGYSSIGSIDLACDYLWFELLNSYTGVTNVLKTATSIREASDKVLHDFEKPQDQSEAVEVKRYEYASDYYNLYSGSSTTTDNQTIIDNAVVWITNIAYDDSHGYDQTNRWGVDYDCSSLVIQAYEQAGSPVKTNGASYTGNMEAGFVASGFKSFAYEVNTLLLPGDVLWRTGHTAMYIGDGFIVEAYSNENGGATGGTPGDQTGLEIRVWPFSDSGSWTKVFRLPVSQTPPDPDEPDEPGEPNPVKKHEMSLLMLLLATRR